MLWLRAVLNFGRGGGSLPIRITFLSLNEATEFRQTDLMMRRKTKTKQNKQKQEKYSLLCMHGSLLLTFYAEMIQFPN